MEQESVQLLLEIKDALKNSSSIWVAPFFTLIGTIFGAFVAGYWQYKNSKINLEALSKTKQLEITSEVISKQRQQWMDQIRHTTAGFLAEYDVIVSDMGVNKKTDEEHAALYKSTNQKANLVFLMLNKNKESQHAAMRAIAGIQEVVEIYTNEGVEVAHELYDKHRNDLAQALLEVFNETWGKIKAIE